MKRRTFLKSVGAALAWALLPVESRAESPPEPDFVPVDYNFRTACIADFPTPRVIRPGELVFVGAEGTITQCSTDTPIGVALNDAPRGGTVRVSIYSCGSLT